MSSSNMPTPYEKKPTGTKRGYFVVSVVLLIVLILGTSSSIALVGPGQRGVVMVFGRVQERIMDEGLHFRVPFITAVVRMDVRVQKLEVVADAASRDLQTVLSRIALNYRVNPALANTVYQTLGLEYEIRVISPSIQEAVKSVTARYTAEELITRRQFVGLEIQDTLSERLERFGIVVENFSVVDFEFSEEFNKAIEAKQTAEQLALKAQRDLDRIRIEAQQKIAQAEAEAEALRIQREVLTPELIELRRVEATLRAIDKWNGVLPTVTGGVVPFIDTGPITGGGR